MSAFPVTKSQFADGYQSLLEVLQPFWRTSGWIDERGEFKSGVIVKIVEDLASEKLKDNVEKEDLFINTLELLSTIRSENEVEVRVSGVPYFGAKNFKYEVYSNDSKSVLAKEIVEYLDNRNSDPIDYVKKLYFLKNSEELLAGLKLTLNLEDKLKARNVFTVNSIKPLITETQIGSDDAKYTLTFKLELDNGKTLEIRNSDFFGDRRYLKIEKDYVILPDDIYETIAKQRDLYDVPLVRAGALIANPAATLFSPGTDTSKFDLSEYDQRVAGFEFFKSSKFNEVISSGVQWYKKDGFEVPLLEVRNGDGTTSKVTISEKHLTKIIAQMETSISSGQLGTDGSPLPIKLDDGSFLQTSNETLQLLRSVKETIKEKNITVKNESEKRAHAVAILRPFSEEVVDTTFPNVSLEQSDFEPILSDKCKLKVHQIEGINWLLSSFFHNRGGVLLADDMGLGKTLQIIAFLNVIRNIELVPKLASYVGANNKDKPILVIAPLILLKNWKNEIGKFVNPKTNIKTLILHGDELKKLMNGGNDLPNNWWAGYDLVLTNYRTFSKYQVKILKTKFLVNVFDESQNIKNPDTAQTKAARGLKSQFVICATGTPVENRYLDIWSQVDALYRKPSNPLHMTTKVFKEKIEGSSNPANIIKSALKIDQRESILLRRDKTLLRKANELPEKVILDPFYIKMTDQQEAQEKIITSKYEARPLEALHFLQKLYQHPYLLTEKNYLSATSEEFVKASPKLEMTLKILQEIKAKGEKALVFTLWVKMQAILQTVFRQKFGFEPNVINGDTNSSAAEFDNAESIIERFSKKEGFNILVLSPLAAGAGLNITAANHVIHYGRWWNPAKEDQGTDRAYRIGQTKNVYVYYPILQTQEGRGFDWAMHEIHRKKRSIAYDVLTPISEMDLNLKDVRELQESKK